MTVYVDGEPPNDVIVTAQLAIQFTYRWLNNQSKVGIARYDSGWEYADRMR